MRFPRAHAKQTLPELKRNLQSLFPDAVQCDASAGEIADICAADPKGRKDKRCIGKIRSRELFILVVGEDRAVPVSGVKLTLSHDVTENDRRVADAMAQVFNGDIAEAPDYHKDQELWVSLQQTRFLRIIARYASVNTIDFIRWLRAFENASSLKYEGKIFSTHLIITKKIEWVEGSESLAYFPFYNGIHIDKAIFQEKWVRAISSGGEICLVGYANRRTITGAACIQRLGPNRISLLPPHEKLAGLCSSLVPGTLAFAASSTGDIHVLFPDGCIFMRTQGKWHYLNYRPLQVCFSKHMSDDSAVALLRLVLDLSYDKKGALFIIARDVKLIRENVPKIVDKAGSNYELRHFSATLRLSNDAQLRILRGIAAIDGAMILSREGRVIDAACMIKPPHESLLEKAGHIASRQYPGARTTAAWNGSFYGLAVKVSEDGPITLFEDGAQILQVG